MNILGSRNYVWAGRLEKAMRGLVQDLEHRSKSPICPGMYGIVLRLDGLLHKRIRTRAEPDSRLQCLHLHFSSGNKNLIEKLCFCSMSSQENDLA
ncbi:hypothetical protein AALO_G00066030 [Alosa alosa]|uniref:Uncharacterized protein n=1 Tax=Alosa alosa TaxID=278164 RepID=A0AAV6H5A0_9TELE|nr:hypothetical protein AALO_G00066030 [Alosa alosa]